jgi:mannose-6-phosphate isomerase-like protein (cupin superfamily)
MPKDIGKKGQQAMTARSSRVALAAAILLASLSTAVAAEPPAQVQPPQAEHVPAATLKDYVATAKDGLVFRSATADPAARTLIVRREKAGDVETHDQMNDVMVIQDGEATMVMGGHAEGQQQTRPGEWIGGRIIGGQSYTMRPGDVLWIPAGIPHQMLIAPGGSFTYLAIKTPK